MYRQRLSAIIIHHFFHPDDDVSSRYFSQFAEELSSRNWDVTVFTSNRYCRYPQKQITPKEEWWRGVKISRSHRPGWDQSKRFSRLASSFWLLGAWIFKAMRHRPVDAIIVGSNPQFAALLFPILKGLKKSKLLVHWCHDVFPEAIVADEAGQATRSLAHLVKRFMKMAYARVDLMADLGQCMRTRLDAYHHQARRRTLVPWAFVENEGLREPDAATRRELFADAKLAILYSGTMGRAHDFGRFLELARRIRGYNSKIVFSFACRGNRYDELCAAITPGDGNIRLGPFASEEELDKRLNSADLHLLSLRPGWEGIVVPSKFFGSLAVGKPVIYAGPETSDIARWIRELEVGLILTENNLDEVMDKLLAIAHNKDELTTWQQNALKAYRQHFSRKYIMDTWDKVMRELLQ